MVDEFVASQTASEDAVEAADLNTASLRRLVQIPGVGRALARRIIEARPFKNLQDLERVEGLGKKRREEITPYVRITDLGTEENIEIAAPVRAEELQFPESTEDRAEPSQVGEVASVYATSSKIPVGESVPSADTASTQVDEKDEPAKPQPAEKAIIPYSGRQQAYATRRFVLWSLFLGGCVLLVFAVLLTLGILSSMNNGLQYTSTRDLIPMEQDIKAIKSELDTLHTDLSGVRTRLDNLEGLSGRLTALESAQESIQTQQDDLKAQIEKAKQSVQEAEKKVEVMQNQVGEVQAIVDLMKSQVEKFRGFLDGLSKLMGGLVIP